MPEVDMELRFRTFYLSSAVVLLLLVNGGWTYSYNRKQDAWIKYLMFIPVDKFARVDLCGNHLGLDLFFEKLQTRLCTFNDGFVDSFMSDLCFRDDAMLIHWVSELFDQDGNGYISYHEQVN